MIKKLSLFFFQILITIIILDVIFLLFLPNKIKNISIFYLADENKYLTKGFPKNYFENNKERGFDIKRSVIPTKTQLPNEIQKPYDIFSNSIGCFDNENKANENAIIYLAGDSFTWGFSPHEKRFSNILDDELKNYKIYNCGVPHTGQFHQYSKFLGIFKNLENLSAVIVNIYENDIENDFFFPHSKVINGYLVDDKSWCLRNNKINILTKSKKELQNNFKSISVSNKIISKLAKYSASANILYFFYKKIKVTYFSNLFNKTTCPKYSNNIYEYSKEYKNNNFHLDGYIKNLQNWIDHSKNNNYELIFSLIPNKYSERKEIEIIFNYIKNQNVKIFRFKDYIFKNKIEKKKLYWKNDVHFNFKGHNEFANYLKEIVNTNLNYSL